jgi:uncharacterized coiled-coil protein SlyX
MTMDARLLDLELKMEHAQRDIEELKDLLLTLTHNIYDIQHQINDLIDSK